MSGYVLLAAANWRAPRVLLRYRPILWLPLQTQEDGEIQVHIWLIGQVICRRFTQSILIFTRYPVRQRHVIICSMRKAYRLQLQSPNQITSTGMSISQNNGSPNKSTLKNRSCHRHIFF